MEEISPGHNRLLHPPALRLPDSRPGSASTHLKTDQDRPQPHSPLVGQAVGETGGEDRERTLKSAVCESVSQHPQDQSGCWEIDFCPTKTPNLTAIQELKTNGHNSGVVAPCWPQMPRNWRLEPLTQLFTAASWTRCGVRDTGGKSRCSAHRQEPCADWQASPIWSWGSALSSPRWSNTITSSQKLLQEDLDSFLFQLVVAFKVEGWRRLIGVQRKTVKMF